MSSRNPAHAPSSRPDEPSTSTEFHAAFRETHSRLLSSVNSASEAAQKFWIVLLTIAIYLTVTVSGITHLDLLLDTPATLPLISIKVPLAGFFVAAPVLLVAVHFSLLLQHEFLFQKISALRTATQGQTTTAKAEALSIWSQLHWYFFSQAFSQMPSRIPMLVALQTLTVTSLLLVPPMLLLYFQIAFLPYHDVAVTWWHRGCLIIDVLLLLLFADSFWSANRNVAKQLSAGRSPFGGAHSPMRRFFVRAYARGWSRRIVKLAAALAHFGILRSYLYGICAFSVVVATVPEELLDRAGRWIWPVHVPLYEPAGDLLARYRQRVVFYPTAFVFERYHDPSSVTQGGLFGWSRNLGVTNADLSGRSLAGRDLRYAIFLTSKLQETDFRFADLSGARFDGTSAARANFRGASLRAAEFVASEAPSANFSSAHLERLLSLSSKFIGANFNRATLTLASLENSNFDGATFESAYLEGALLYETNMRGAVLDLACLHGLAFHTVDNGLNDDTNGDEYLAHSSERSSDLRGSSFRSAELWQSPTPAAAAIQYTNFEHAVLKPVAGKQRQTLSRVTQNLAFALVPEIVQARISALIAPNTKEWQNSMAFAWWKGRIETGRQSSDGEQLRGERATFLGRFICSDVSDGAQTANAIAARIAGQQSEQFTAVALVQALSHDDCLAGKKVSEQTLSQLKQLARSATEDEVLSLVVREKPRRPGVGEPIRVAACERR